LKWKKSEKSRRGPGGNTDKEVQARDLLKQ